MFFWIDDDLEAGGNNGEAQLAPVVKPDSNVAQAVTGSAVDVNDCTWPAKGVAHAVTDTELRSSLLQFPSRPAVLKP